MPRILHLYKSYYGRDFGGVGQVIQQIAGASRDQGYTHDVLVLHEGRSLEVVDYDEARVHYVPRDIELLSTPMGWRMLAVFRRLVRDADLVHYHFPYPVADLLDLLVRPGCPTLVTYHSDIVKQKLAMKLYAPLMGRFLGSADRIVATSDNYCRTSPVLQRYQDKLSVVPLGLEEQGYPQVEPARLAHWRNQVGENFFFFVGALRYYKGLEYLIEAARISGLPVVIAGAGGIEQALHAQAAGLDNVHFVGRVEEVDKAALFQLCGALAFPSHLRSEAFGISLIEACMYGKPMISAEIGTGTTFVNEADVTGLVVPPADAEQLAMAMRRMQDDPQMMAAMGQAARQRFEQHFTARRMADSYQQLYARLLDQRRGSRVVKSGVADLP